MTNNEAVRCKDCGRPKAFSADQCADGYCPKWYAVRDKEARYDCFDYSRHLNHKLPEDGCAWCASYAHAKTAPKLCECPMPLVPLNGGPECARCDNLRPSQAKAVSCSAKGYHYCAAHDDTPVLGPQHACRDCNPPAPAVSAQPAPGVGAQGDEA